MSDSRKSILGEPSSDTFPTEGLIVILTKHLASSPPLLPVITFFARWMERRRGRKAIEMRLATVLTLVLKFPVTTALVYSQEVHYNYERSANFSAYKTYQWVDTATVDQNSDLPRLPKADAGVPPSLSAVPNFPAPPPVPLGGKPYFPAGTSDIRDPASEDQLINQEIRRAIDEQLAQKGLTKVDKDADLYVGYHAAIHQEQSLYVSTMGWGGPSRLGLWDGSAQGQTSSVPIGTVVVDLYDPAQKQLIWRGDATKTIELKKDPDKNYKNLQKALTKLFRNYPPQRGK